MVERRDMDGQNGKVGVRGMMNGEWRMKNGEGEECRVLSAEYL